MKDGERRCGEAVSFGAWKTGLALMLAMATTGMAGEPMGSGPTASQTGWPEGTEGRTAGTAPMTDSLLLPAALQMQLTAFDGAAGDWYGHAVAVTGDTAVVGAPKDRVGDNYEQGSAYVYQRDAGGTTNWGLVKKLTAFDGIGGDGFGYSVSMAGDFIAVGAPSHDEGAIPLKPDQGVVYVFGRNAGGTTNWGLVKRLVSSDGASYDTFGSSVSIGGDVIVVGAPGCDVGSNADQGAVYVFSRDAGGTTNWGQVKRLTGSGGAAYDWFGGAVSVAGDTIAVGAYNDQVGANASQGSAYVFNRDAGGTTNWGQVKQIVASDGAAQEWFGYAVGAAEDDVVVGAFYKTVSGRTWQGAAYVFGRNAGGTSNWGQVKQLLASDGAANELFGWSVCVAGDVMVVGAPCNASSAFPGSAYVFGRDVGGASNWGEARKITAGDGAAKDRFGYSVSASSDSILVGAAWDDVSGKANQGSAHLEDAGSAEVATPPEIESMAAHASDMVLRWSATHGPRYTLQYAPNLLGTPAWSNVPPAQRVGPASAPWEMWGTNFSALEEADVRFFRVLMEP